MGTKSRDSIYGSLIRATQGEKKQEKDTPHYA
jgi:hypothetical protein